MAAPEVLGRMAAYGTEHILALVGITIAAVLLVSFARTHRGSVQLDRGLRIAGWVLLLSSLAWQIWTMLPANWDIEQSLPFHLSDALRFVTAIALITRSDWAIALSYYWGLTLNLQSVITPDLTYSDRYVLEYIEYWYFHGTVLLVPIVLCWGLGYRPSWRGYAFTLASTFAWAGVAGIANAVTGANYMYLARAPEIASALDVLGPWPMYILSEVALVSGVWALITWPWVRGSGARETVVCGRFGAVRRCA